MPTFNIICDQTDKICQLVNLNTVIVNQLTQAAFGYLDALTQEGYALRHL